MAARRKVRFGIIGLGLMGREFGSAIARWCHLLFDGPVPELAGICDTSEASHGWFTDNFPTIRTVTTKYEDLLAAKDIEAVYCAVPHALHRQLYVDIISAGKHLMGEKPFGMDKPANDAILAALAANPKVFARCSSEFPYFPAVQRIISWIQAGKLGRIIEVRSGFHHSSDMDVTKPINWKRLVEVNGEYGCMGDLGIHTQHIPFRVGWVPKTVYASLSKIVDRRPDGKGGTAPCLTWDNASLCCTVEHAEGYTFPMVLETKRMAPGMTNTWYIEVDGLKASVRFSTRDPKAFFFLLSGEKEQPWCRLDMGYTPAVPTITGSIFEFGFSDSILQMWAAFLLELENGAPPVFGCFTPEETRLSHALQSAALDSHRKKSVEQVR
jgi:predicted dehydrogenase